MTKTLRYGCPRCGSEAIEEANQVTVMYEITAWDENGCPVHYGNVRETEAIEREEPPYWCYWCGKGFSEPKPLDPQADAGEENQLAFPNLDGDVKY